jgi:hypothetical protein
MEGWLRDQLVGIPIGTDQGLAWHNIQEKKVEPGSQASELERSTGYIVIVFIVFKSLKLRRPRINR